MAVVTTRSSHLATTLLLSVLAAAFFFLSMEVALSLNSYGGWIPADDAGIQTGDFRDMAEFAVAEENKKTNSKSEKLRLVSIDKGFYNAAPATDYVYYRVDLTATSARFGQVKYSAVVVNALSGILVLDDFERR